MSADGEVVLDASALIALLADEPGADVVEAELDRAVVSAVNWAEILQRYVAYDLPIAGKRVAVESLGVRIEPFTAEDAEHAAVLREVTRAAGLSLADRACLALGRRLGTRVYTADRAWREVEVGVEVALIR
jgi:ribonuclease VapC